MRFSSSEACLEQILECEIIREIRGDPNRDLFHSPINVDECERPEGTKIDFRQASFVVGGILFF
jgi:hypothetical protein